MALSVAVTVGLLLAGIDSPSRLSLLNDPKVPGVLVAQAATDVIDTLDGKTYVGRIVDENSRGYLFQPEGGGPVLIEYSRIRAVRRGGARAQPAPAPAPAPEPVGAPEPAPVRERSYAPSAEDFADRVDVSEVWGKRDVRRMSQGALINELQYLRDARPGIGAGLFDLIFGGSTLIAGFIFLGLFAASSYGFIVPAMICLGVAVVTLTIGAIALAVQGGKRARMSERIDEIERRLDRIDSQWQYRSDARSPAARPSVLLATF